MTTDKKTTEKQELGPRQRAWVESLRAHPERQMTMKLGELFTPKRYKACCLGEAVCVRARRLGNKLPFNKQGFIHTEGTERTDQLHDIEVDYYKLNSTNGRIEGITFDFKSKKWTQLTTANDYGATWPEIADFIEAHPEAVFTEPA